MFLVNLRSKLIYLGIIVVVLIVCYNIFSYNSSTTAAIVTLNAIHDDSINVLLGDSITTVDIKIPELVSSLLVVGNEYFIEYDTFPVLGSKLTKIEPSP